MTDLQNNLPPGWESRYDDRSGRHYYINHYTKTTTWDDPRNRHRQFQAFSSHATSRTAGECIPLQHGSPELRRNYVYPSHTSPIPAFQMPAYMSPKSIPLQDMKPKMSPLSVKSSKVQDTSLTTSDTEESVATIRALFPTVSETHIKLLLKKYHNREALVISALQVEKYPITTPGPFATPPPQRNIHQPLSATPPPGIRAYHSRGGSPIARPGSAIVGNNIYTNSPRIGEHFRNSPRPQSSPKLKLRYMKSVFPQADETIILEVLQNNENNIQKTSETLKNMGFEKKDTVKVAQQKLEAKMEQKREEEKIEAEKSQIPQIKLRTADEKKRMKTELQEKYKDVAEHLICIALESVDFDEDKASHILQAMIKEDSENGTNGANKTAVDSIDVPSTSVEMSSSFPLPISQSRQSLKSLMKVEKEMDKVSFSRVVEECENGYRSMNLSNTKGPNPEGAKGANDDLLLEDYVKWQGPNPNLKKGPQGLANGPNRDLLLSRSYQACGANKDLVKGPKFGLAKGSIFSQLRIAVVGDNRAK